MQNLILQEIKISIDVKQKILENKQILDSIEKIVNACLNALRSGGKIIFCGNGGSFADSQHLAAEFVSRLRFDRVPLASIALGTNSSNMSAIGNDYGYDKVFAREIDALANEIDVFIPISTSGNSPNVINAIKTATKKGINIFGLTGGNGGEMKELCENIIVPSSSTEKIQEAHIMIGHIICYLVEKTFFNK